MNEIHKNQSQGSSPNARKRWLVPVLVVAAVALFALGVLAQRAFNPPAAAQGAAAQSHDHDAEQDAAPQEYTCPMHHDVRMPNPDDRCPKCGMKLIPVTQDEGDEPGNESLPELRVSPRSAALLQVQVQPVARQSASVPVQFYGQLEFDETRVRDVNIKTSGWIEKLHLDYVGAPVKRGDPLFEMYSPELHAAQQEYLIAKRHLGEDDASAAGLLAAARKRLLNYDLSPQQLDALEKRGETTRTVSLLSPHEGVVVEKAVNEGLKVDPGMVAFRIADLSKLWVQLEAYEADLQWLSLGQSVVFTTKSQPGKQFEGKVTFIDPTVEERSRTANVRVEVANPDGLLKPGMYVSGGVEAAPEETSLIIPASAPLITGRRAVVYVQLPDKSHPTYAARNVTLGPRAGDHYVVHDGLSEGDLVVTNGAFKIDSELQIRGKPSMMQPEGGAPPVHDHGAGPGAAPASPQGADEHADHALVPATEEEIAAYPLDQCVISGFDLHSMGEPVRHMHNGTTVLFCCESCLSDFQKDPQAALDKIKKGDPS